MFGLRTSGIFTPSGDAIVPLPYSVELIVTAPSPALVCTVLSGNLNPPDRL